MDKKRKLQDELPEMPLPKKIQSNRGGESDPESTKSNSYTFNSDSSMSTKDESDPEYPETCSSDMLPTSSSTSFSSFESSLNSSGSTSSPNSTSNGPDSLSTVEQPQHEGQNGQFGSGSDFSLLAHGKDSIDQQPDCPQHEGHNRQFGIGADFSLLEYGKDSIDQQSDFPQHEGLNEQFACGSDFSLSAHRKDSIDQQIDCPQHEGQNELFGSGSEFSLLEYGKDSVDQECIDKDLENLLYLNTVAPNSDYVLSSGRWSVNQDDKKEGKKLTIDKEFEHYFSILML